MNQLISPVSGATLAFYQRVCEALSEAFDAAFEIVDADQFEQRARSGALDLARRAFVAGEASVWESGDGQTLIGVCLQRSQGGMQMACGVVPVTDRRLAGELARQVYRNATHAQRSDEIEVANSAYVAQVTHDFEETCWLQSLSRGLKYCDAASKVSSVADAVLPALCELINAEAIALLPAPRSAESAAEAGGPLVTAYQCGPVEFDNELLEQIVDRFASDCARRPVVYNAHSELAPCCPPEVRNLIVVQISQGRQQFGYLLALNKVPPADGYQSEMGYSATTYLDEREFGTIEATLVNSAGIMLATHASNVQLFRDKEQLLIGIVRALINAMDAKDQYTCGHSDRVALMGRRIAEEIGFDEHQCERVYMTGLLHDIGKIGVPDEILSKPGKLTEAEFDRIKQHPGIGHSILRHVKQLEYVLPGVLHHHESVDGRGYPHGLAGTQIPLLGRILAVADAYDAMTSCRPYRDAMPSAKAESILRDGAGKQWDADIVAAFLNVLPDIQRICSQAEQHTQNILSGSGDVSGESSDAVHAAVTAMHGP